ncbi:MAG: tail fiber assembly protein [Gilliamella sp.]|uniref:tail fiber assembly protein n=1 Tax=Gilliamella sp. TaxID=1891236 RepID=UPI0025FA80DC|nr:tail fiber assembly protein [Gilliamella sp.]MCO6545366.1 tail fiber assembly protein [Gilliamella sp.]
MKYQLQPETAILDSNGITTTAGWAVVYHVDSNGEYSGATHQYLPVGVGVPASSYLDAPKSVKDGKAIIRVGDKWAYPVDHRGKKIYSTKTGAESTVTEIGDIPNDYTLLKPSSEFDAWNGEKWVLDENKQHQHDVDVATAQKKQLLNEATTQIDYLQDAIDTEIATDEEKALHLVWKKYRALLNRIDVDAAPEITWPEKP